MTEAANAPEGQLIEGRYRIVRQIAQGGMATVYEAQDERLARPVAVKVMHTQLAQGPHRDQFIERFRREARSAARIANPHIVQVYDAGEYHGLAYLVMEYVHGVNLRHEMNAQGTFSVRQTLRIVAETLDGLSSAHQVNVVHRDIKPENIMLNDRGHVQITDFGLAKATSQATLSSTGMLLGTAAYLPPETIERNEATPQGDLYAVGIMAWEMLAGEVPFISDNPVTLVFKHVHEDVPSVAVPCPGIDPSVARFIAHLTERDIAARSADATAAAAELRDVMRSLTVEAWQYRRTEDGQGVGEHVDAGASVVAGAAGAAGALPAASLAVSAAAGASPADAAETHALIPAPPSPAPSDASDTSDAERAAQPAETTSATGAARTAGATTQIPPTTAMAVGETQVLAPLAEPQETQPLDLYDFADDDEGAGTAAAQPAARTASSVAAAAGPAAVPDDARTMTLRPVAGQIPPTGVASAAVPPAPPAPASAAGAPMPTPHADGTGPMAAPAGQPAKRKGHGKAIIIAIAVILCLALAGGGGFAWWYYRGPGSYWELPKPDDVTCEANRACTLEGATWSAYEGTLKVAGIPYKITREYSDTADEGTIVSAKLNGGDAQVDMHVSKRHTPTLEVVVSKGVRMATIPDDILDPNSAHGKAPLDALKEAGFDNVKHDESQDVYSETLPEGVALSVSPDPGTTLKHNAEITVALSKGPMPVTMPDIVGRTKDEATTALNDLKLKANWSEAYSDTVEAGKVLSSSVAKDTQLHWGDSVDVVVSKGPEMVTIPDVRGKTYDEAAKTLEALGLSVKKSAPLGDVTHTVRLQSPDPGEQVRVRDEKGNKTVVTLTVV
ncbi:protein kinase domain-containing protein [Bifidobacterium aesculapii]|uniref:protein kinase domain-containing protein n=1 Tax=Bifidobacterium aesculapii TaxID=1329411 RepID=UPI0006E31082|nr:PASTA domain-containing protein [Bifidobacterium aesculapii]